MTSSSSLARSKRTFVSTATSGFLFTLWGIDHLHPPMEESLTFFIRERVSH
jgi:hypothetical protein